MEQITTAILIKHGVMAVFSALVHALIEYREGKTRTLLDMFIITIISSFSGVMFGLIALRFFPNDVYFSLAITGTGGVMGVEGLRIVTRQIVNVLKVTLK